MKKYWNDYSTAVTELRALTSIDTDELSINEIDKILILLEDCFSAAHMLNCVTSTYEEEYEFYAELKESKISAADCSNEGYEEFWASINLYY